jgi:hypothetical protein
MLVVEVMSLLCNTFVMFVVVYRVVFLTVPVPSTRVDGQGCGGPSLSAPLFLNPGSAAFIVNRSWLPLLLAASGDSGIGHRRGFEQEEASQSSQAPHTVTS